MTQSFYHFGDLSDSVKALYAKRLAEKQAKSSFPICSSTDIDLVIKKAMEFSVEHNSEYLLINDLRWAKSDGDYNGLLEILSNLGIDSFVITSNGRGVTKLLTLALAEGWNVSGWYTGDSENAKDLPIIDSNDDCLYYGIIVSR